MAVERGLKKVFSVNREKRIINVSLKDRPDTAINSSLELAQALRDYAGK